MAPLYALTSSKNTIDWKPAHEKIRTKIISVLTNEPIPIIFDPNCPIELHTDASSVGYGAVLMQRKNDRLRLVAYYSKRTTDICRRKISFLRIGNFSSSKFCSLFQTIFTRT